MKRAMAALFGTAMLASIVTGCARDVTPTDAPQGAYEVTAGLAAALKSANAYAALPRCTATVQTFCSNQTIVRKISVEAERANVAVQAVQQVARDTRSSASDTQQAISAANKAIFVLVALIPNS